ncbi:uncharacterized protein LOC143301855 [Babylonia areolata]|uniref:uncharacterized protein LOC143301855 n=1 Tax=Babylonia areolata TaxID=304850 RepID=UPI003FD00B34
MWKNWFSFLKQDGKQEDSSGRPSAGQRKGKENGGKNDRCGGIGDGNGRSTERQRIRGSVPRSTFTRSGGSAEYHGSADDSVRSSNPVTNPSGHSLLTTPLLPKIKRVIELNESFGGGAKGYSSPLASSPGGSQVRRSHSLNYGPTHPTRSTPGRLPIVRLQRRPSLHLISGRNVQSPSTVKIAAPDRSLVPSSPRFLVTPSPSTSPERGQGVDTHTVISALRERSSRKRSTLASRDDGMMEEEYTQMAKRRRQDSTMSTSSSVSMPTMPDKLPDLSRQSEGFSPLLQLQPLSLKRPSSAPRRGSVEEGGGGGEALPMAKREKRHSNGRILSSLSSYKRPSVEEGGAVATATATSREEQRQVSEAEVQQSARVNKRTRPDAAGPDERLPATKRDNRHQGPDDLDTSREPQSSTSNAPGETQPRVPPKEKQASLDARASTPQKKALKDRLEQKATQRSGLRQRAPVVRPVAVASPADLESDRRAEETMRVQAMLAFLDDDEEHDAFSKSTVASSSTTSTSATTTTTTTSTQPLRPLSSTTAAVSTTTTTTTPSLSQLLSTPLSTSSQPVSTPSLLPSLLTTKTSGGGAVSTPSSRSALATSVAGLAPLSGGTGSVGFGGSSGKPVSSTGGAGSLGSTPSAPTLSAAAALASLSGVQPTSSSLSSSS